MAIPKEMLEAHIDKETNVTLHKVPVPEITNPSHVLIKVIVSGLNPKDWKMPADILKTIGHCPNSGDDIAGIVVAVGKDVHDFRPGDRVAALHQLGTPHGSFAEYSLAWDFTTMHIGNEMSFEDAACMPMAVYMASLALFAMLGVNGGPWVKSDKPKPLVIYGAASSVGSMAVKLATLVNIHPIICVAGHGIPFDETLIDHSKGDCCIDYRHGDEAVVKGIKDALKGAKLQYAFDAVSEHGSYINLGRVLDTESGKITLVLPRNLKGVIPDGIEQTSTMAASIWPGLRSREDIAETPDEVGNVGLADEGPEFATVYSKLFSKWMREGKLVPPPYEVHEEGLQGLGDALKRLRNGETHKFVVRISETPELAGKA